MGLHPGEPAVGEARYTGLGVHRAARISAAGHGGQILLSETTRSLVEDDPPPGVRLRDLGRVKLKDLDRPERITQVVVEGLPTPLPAPAERRAHAELPAARRACRCSCRRDRSRHRDPRVCTGRQLGRCASEPCGGHAQGPSAREAASLPGGDRSEPSALAAGSDDVWVASIGGAKPSDPHRPRDTHAAVDPRWEQPVGGRRRRWLRLGCEQPGRDGVEDRSERRRPRRHDSGRERAGGGRGGCWPLVGGELDRPDSDGVSPRRALAISNLRFAGWRGRHRVRPRFRLGSGEHRQQRRPDRSRLQLSIAGNPGRQRSAGDRLRCGRRLGRKQPRSHRVPHRSWHWQRHGLRNRRGHQPHADHRLERRCVGRGRPQRRRLAYRSDRSRGLAARAHRQPRRSSGGHGKLAVRRRGHDRKQPSGRHLASLDGAVRRDRPRDRVTTFLLVGVEHDERWAGYLSARRRQRRRPPRPGPRHLNPEPVVRRQDLHLPRAGRDPLLERCACRARRFPPRDRARVGVEWWC